MDSQHPDDVEGHKLAANDNEAVVDDPETPADAPLIADAEDVEGHRLASNDNETVVED
jgi:hypothetical protein